MPFTIRTRVTVKGSGYYFSDPTTKFKDVFIKESMFIFLTGFKYIYFTYDGKYHYRKLTQGRYGEYFRFGSTTYYILKD